MAYDDRSVKPMSASLMRARVATKLLAGLYEDVPTMLTSAIRLMVELPGGKGHDGPPYPFTIGVSPAWCSGLNGAKLVAKAWIDTEFKARFIADPKAACAEIGIDATAINEFVVLENTPTVRHMVVCTLCSCYPRPILGRPPDWYKSLNYRQRSVSDPRGVMREFGLELPDDVEVRVHDSTADIRYIVMPLRPAGTAGWSEDDLAKLVTRDSMIGVMNSLPTLPD